MPTTLRKGFSGHFNLFCHVLPENSVRRRSWFLWLLIHKCSKVIGRNGMRIPNNRHYSRVTPLVPRWEYSLQALKEHILDSNQWPTPEDASRQPLDQACLVGTHLPPPTVWHGKSFPQNASKCAGSQQKAPGAGFRVIFTITLCQVDGRKPVLGAAHFKFYKFSDFKRQYNNNIF
jgi:hypothetical protein